MTNEQPPNLPPGVFMQPPNLLQFVSTEHQQFLTSLINCHDEIGLQSHIHDLYAAGMSFQSVEQNNVVIVQLLTFVHYHFQFSTSSYLRCHMAEAFNSARVAIDATLIVAEIIRDRASQAAYIARTKPFDKLLRHFQNMIKDKKPVHEFIEYLIQMHQFCSQFSSHADIQTFMDRVDFHGEPIGMMSVGYFQVPKDDATMKHHFLVLLKLFTMCLDVFADFLVNEQKAVSEAWREQVRRVGRHIEDRQRQLLPQA